MKPKITTNKSTLSPRRQTQSGQSHSIPMGPTSAYKSTLVLKVNAIPENQIETLQTKPRITKSASTLSACNGSNKPVKGQCTLDIQHRCKNVSLLFIIADANSPPVIGLNSSKQLNLIKRILSISNSQKRNFLNKYKDCFGEIGTLHKVHHITIDQNITLFVTLARKIPIALLCKLKLELERMRRLDKIEPVSETTE